MRYRASLHPLVCCCNWKLRFLLLCRGFRKINASTGGIDYFIGLPNIDCAGIGREGRL